MIANGVNCPDKLFSTFYNKYNKIVNKHASFKRMSNRKAKQLSKPWITTGIKVSIAVKSKLHASGDDSRYKYYRNKICSLIRLRKKRYYYDYFEHNVANIKKTWEGINEVLYRRKRNFKNITKLKDKGKIVKEASQIPNILNKHFASVGTRLASKLPPPPKHHLDYVSKCISPLSSFLFEHVFPDEIRSEILSIPNDKSYGLYSSPTKLLKLSSSIIAPVLSELLNISNKSGSYPSKLKIAKITPIFKSDDESDANNYRPISILSNFNRIFEKIMYKRMTSYLGNIIYYIRPNTVSVKDIPPNMQYWTSLMTFKLI